MSIGVSETIDKNDLQNVIYNLLITVKDNIETFNVFESDELGTYDEHFVKIECRFNYNNGINSSNSSYSEPYIKTLKFWKNFEKYYYRNANQFFLLKEIPDLLMEKFKINHAEAIQYLIFLFDKILIYSASDSELISIANRFVKDLNKDNPDWHLIVFIKGIWVKDEEVSIDETILFRQPRPEDLSREKSLTSHENDIKYHYLVSAVIEIKKQCVPKTSLYGYLKKLFICLMLYKMTSIFPVKCIYKANSILTKSDYTIYPEKSDIYGFGIDSSDKEPLKYHIETILPMLPDENWRSDNTELSYIYLAIERYTEALRDDKIESRITTAVTCLEALYCDGDNREISHKLSQRTAFFLRFYGYNPLEVYEAVKKEAYSVRSSYAHGSFSKKYDKIKLNEICENILNYSRNSITAHLQIYKKLNFKKSDLIKLIDSAMIDKNSCQKLEEYLNAINFTK